MSRPQASVTVLFAIAAWLSTGCAPDEASSGASYGGSALRIVDATGSEVVLARPATRVVSLVPSATETLRAIGSARVLVGRTDFDRQQWAAALPSVGGGLEPDLESLVALRPDLVVRFAGEQDPRTPSRLDDLGIPHIAVRPDRIDDIYATARMLGQATGRPAAADSLIASLGRSLAAVANAVRGLRRVPTVYVLGGSPPWVAGPNTYIHEVLTLAGGDNVFADLPTLYAAVSPEQLRTREVEVVLLSAGASYDRSLTPGARVEVVGDALEIPGPGVVEAASRVADLLHGPGRR
jgi:iron complex transport system substrate-binding protein